MVKALVIFGLTVAYLYFGHNLRNRLGFFWAYFGFPLGFFFWFTHG